jgi:hypothetical protein
VAQPGLPRVRPGLASDADARTLRRLTAGGEVVGLIREAPDDLAATRAQVFQAAIAAYRTAEPERAEELREQVRALWSRAWPANYAGLEFLQGTGLSRFSPVKPRRWIVAPFEHHTSRAAFHDRISTTSSSI